MEIHRANPMTSTANPQLTDVTAVSSPSLGAAADTV
jgi:hypothetical protein